MSLKKETVQELGDILKRKFSTEMEYKDLEKFANCLVGYFDLLIKIEQRNMFENRPTSLIDTSKQEEDNTNIG